MFEVSELVGLVNGCTAFAADAADENGLLGILKAADVEFSTTDLLSSVVGADATKGLAGILNGGSPIETSEFLSRNDSNTLSGLEIEDTN